MSHTPLPNEESLVSGELLTIPEILLRRRNNATCFCFPDLIPSSNQQFMLFAGIGFNRNMNLMTVCAVCWWPETPGHTRLPLRGSILLFAASHLTPKSEGFR